MQAIAKINNDNCIASSTATAMSFMTRPYTSVIAHSVSNLIPPYVTQLFKNNIITTEHDSTP